MTRWLRSSLLRGVGSMSEHVHGTEWALVLSDWRRANADVSVHLRGGVSLGPGKVDRLPGPGLDAAQLIGFEPVTRAAIKWTFDLAEVAAITAVAR